MRLDKYQLVPQLVWAIPSFALVMGLAVWYVWASRNAGVWLQGGSLPALGCGVVAAGIVFFELLLGLRKRLRAWRLLPARYWLAAHLWLGLATLPLACLHSGFQFGGWLPAILLWLLAGTYLSGLFGWAMQHFIPPLMLKYLPAETITSEIDEVSRRNLADLRQMLTSALGPSSHLASGSEEHRKVVLALELEAWAPAQNQTERALTIGAMRESQRVSSVGAVPYEPDLADADRIWQAYAELIPYVSRGQSSKSWLADQPSAESYFANLAQACELSTRPVIGVMKSVCDQRRQFDLQRKFTNWLVVWVPLHVGMGSALGVLLIVHIITALRYW